MAGLIDERREQLSSEHDLDCRIVGIATRRHGAVAAADGIDVRTAIERVGGDAVAVGVLGSFADGGELELTRFLLAWQAARAATTIDLIER